MVETIRRLRPGPGAVALAVLVVVYAWVLSYLSILRHEQFRTGAYDLGIFDQALWLISRGEMPWVEFRGLHILGDHAAFVLYLLAPLYWIWADARLLLVLQSVVLAGGAVPVYLLARHQGAGEGAASTFAASYLLYPALSNMNLFHFHPEALAVPALLWAGYAARLDRPRWWLAGCFLAVSCKAVIALPVMVWAAWRWWRRGARPYLVTAIAAGFWFWFASFYLIPALTGSPPTALQRYQQWGDSPAGIMRGLLAQPGELLKLMWWRSHYAFDLLFPLGFLPLLAPGELLPAGAMFLANILSDRGQQQTLTYQYNAAIMPFLWFAVLAAYGWLRQRARAFARLLPVMVLVLTGLGFWVYSWNSMYHETWVALVEREDPLELELLWQAVALIPPEASVLSDQRMLPHLTHRHHLRMASDYMFPAALQDDYVVLDIRSKRGKHLLSPEIEKQLVDFCRHSPAFVTLAGDWPVYVFRRRPGVPAPVFMYHTPYALPTGPVPH